MNIVRRCTIGAVMLALFLSAATVRAQAAGGDALKQLPADAMAVIKINNLQAVNDKIVAMTQRLGLAQMAEPLADPLGALKKQLNIKEGLNTAGDLVIGLYEPGAGETEPRAVVLIPVTDFKGFMGNQPTAKEEGNLTTFNVNGEQFYAANRAGFAAVTPTKDLLANPPAGVNVTGIARKQLDANDITVFVNTKALAAKGLPELQNNRANIINGLEGELKNNAQFNQKFTPAVKALVEQLINVAEGTLKGTQSATLGLALSKEGVNFTAVGDFDPNSYGGQVIAACKTSNQPDLLTGLPARKYLAYGGMLLDRKTTTKVFDDFTGPIVKELQTAGDDAKPILNLINASKSSLSATDATAAAYVMPTGQPGQQSAVQEIAVIKGDAKAIAAASRQSLSGLADLMKMLPKQAEAQINFDLKPDAKNVDGTSLDQFAVQFKFDEKTPEGAQAAQMMGILYGGTSMNGFMGAVNDNTYVTIMGGDEDLLKATVAAAKKGDNPLAAQDTVKAVAAKLPQQRSAVFYIALDNIITLGIQYANQFGLPVQIKLPADLPPIGVTVGNEGSALRIDAHLPADLIDSLVAAGIQAGMQGGRRRGGAL